MTRRIVTTACIGLALTLTVHAAPSAARVAPTEPERPTAWLTQDTSPPTPATLELQRELGDGSLTYQRFLELRSEALAADELMGGGGFKVPAKLAADAASEDTDAVGYPLSAGDLDGDGRDDVLALSVDPFWHELGFESEAVLSGLSGTDGRTMWTVELGPHDAFQPADLDGDGDTEIALLRLDIVRGPVWVLDQRVEVLDGETGDALWSEEIVGTAVVGVAGAVAAVGDVYAFAFAEVVGVKDIVLGIATMPDADGDGASELLVSRFELGEAGAFARAVFGTGAGTMVSRLRAATLDGETGAQIGEIETVSVGDIPWTVPTADLSGDGLADVVLLEQEGYSDVLHAVSVDGDTHWRAPTDSYGIPTAPGDLTGDGLADVLVRDWSDWWYGDAYTSSLELHDGADGSLAWTADTNETPFVFLTGPDGQATDLLAVGWVWSEESGALRVLTLDGATGDQVWSRDVPETDQSWVMWCNCLDDLSGDGNLDLLVAVLDWSDPDVFRQDLLAVDGSGGADLWSVSLIDDTWFPVSLGADANENGAGDLYDLQHEGEEGDQLVLSVTEGSNASALWSATDADVGSYPWITGVLGGDLTGAAGAEVVLGFETYDEDEGWAPVVRAYGPGGRLW